MPIIVGGFLCWFSGEEGGGAWWFENWIVDASKEKLKERFFLLIAISPNSSIRFGFRDRSFCDHFSVKICRLAIAIRKPAGGTMVLLLCRLRGRMVDALADSTDEGRLRMR